MTDTTSLSDLVEQQVQASVQQVLAAALSTAIKQAIDSSVQQLIQNTISNLLIDTVWLQKIETLTNQAMASKVVQQLSVLDLTSIVSQEVDNSFNRWHQTLLKDFKTNGIVDHATSTQLTITDDLVEISNTATAKDLYTDNTTVTGVLTTQNLIVKGSINTDNNSWNELVDKVADSTLVKLNGDWKTVLVA